MYRWACSMRPIGTSIALGAAQPRRWYVLGRGGYVLGRANGAPFWGAAACRVKPELPSVHLFSAGQVRQNPASARLPRLVARGYTGLAVTGLLSVSSFYDGSAGL